MSTKFFDSAGVYAVAPDAIGIECTPVMQGWTMPFPDSNGVATIPITAPLTYRYDNCSIAYQDIRMALHAALRNDNVTSVVLKFNSPGGDVDGGFDLARDIRAMRASYGKPIIAFTDGMCASMAYALASACDKIIASPTASVGSIGVIAQLVDVTEADKQAGIKFNVQGSGARKTDSNPHTPINAGAKEALQTRVSALANEFFALVDTHRGCGAKHWESLEAGLFVGNDAKEVGLCDEIMTLGELQANIGGMLPTATKPDSVAPSNNMNLTEALATIAALEAKVTSLSASVKAAEDEKKDEEEKAKAKAKAEECEKEAKAKAEEDEKRKKDEEEKAKGLASAGVSEALAKSLAEITGKLAALESERAANERASIFAKFPHVKPEVQAAFASVATKDLAAVLNALPKGVEVQGNTKVPTLAEIAVGGTFTQMQQAREASWMEVNMGLAERSMAPIQDSKSEQILGASTYVKDVK